MLLSNRSNPYNESIYSPYNLARHYQHHNNSTSTVESTKIYTLHESIIPVKFVDSFSTIMGYFTLILQTINKNTSNTCS
jgi:hypothetical protein